MFDTFHLGFGLPHIDENPYNCLGASFDLFVRLLLLLLSLKCILINHLLVIMLIDYTNDPEDDLEPGEANMAKLRRMYLSRVESDGAVVETTELLVG